MRFIQSKGKHRGIGKSATVKWSCYCLLERVLPCCSRLRLSWSQHINYSLFFHPRILNYLINFSKAACFIKDFSHNAQIKFWFRISCLIFKLFPKLTFLFLSSLKISNSLSSRIATTWSFCKGSILQFAARLYLN